MRHGPLHMILTAYLTSAGWKKDERGWWKVDPDHPRRKVKARWSLMAAVESQMTGEYYAKREAERVETFNPELWPPVKARA